MQRPASALLNDYLKGMELLEVLREKLQHIDHHSENLTALGYDIGEIRETLDAKLYRLEVWMSETDRQLDESLDESVRRADMGRELFCSVSRSIREWKTMSPAEWGELPESMQLEWGLMVDGFEILSSIWSGYLSAEEGESE